ncbi:MAG: DUF1646 family protein [candidate division WOR-3 bacterium]
MQFTPVDIGLFAIVLLVIGWNMELITEAVMEPIIKGIVPAVLVAGLLFHYGRPYAQSAMVSITKKVPIKIIVFLIVVLLGLFSSVITAIIASPLLVELMNCLPIDRKMKINLHHNRLLLHRAWHSSDAHWRAAFHHCHHKAAGSALLRGLLLGDQPA